MFNSQLFSAVQQVSTAAKVWATSSATKARNASTSPATPTTIKFSEGTPRRGRCPSSAAEPDPGRCLSPPPRSSPPDGLPPPRNLPSLPRQVARGLDPNRSASRGRVPIQTRRDPRPRRQPQRCRGCFEAAAPCPGAAPRTFQPSARRGTARGPPPRPRPGAHLPLGREDPPAPAPAPAGGFSAPPCRPRAADGRGASSVGQSDAAAARRRRGSLPRGWLAREARGGDRGRRSRPGEPGGRRTRGAANGRPRRRWAGSRAEMGGASAHRRGLPSAASGSRRCARSLEAAPGFPSLLLRRRPGVSTWTDSATSLALYIESPLSGNQRNVVRGMMGERDRCLFPLHGEGAEGLPSLAETRTR